MATSKSEQPPLSLRVICVNPPDVALQGDSLEFGLQDKAEVIHSGALQPDGSVVYVCQAIVRPRKGDAPPDFAGPHIHGVRGGRFLYLSLRKSDGGFRRRLKIPLRTISWAQIGMVQNERGTGLAATVEGRGSGTVPLLDDGWTLYAA
jgi:hypothetical protein